MRPRVAEAGVRAGGTPFAASVPLLLTPAPPIVIHVSAPKMRESKLPRTFRRNLLPTGPSPFPCPGVGTPSGPDSRPPLLSRPPPLFAVADNLLATSDLTHVRPPKTEDGHCLFY